MPPQPTEHIKTRRNDNVRIGPVSIITLIFVVCMAVMSVLAASTSYANQSISQRHATATQYMYLNESAGQEFVAGVDDVLAGVRASGGDAYDGVSAVRAQLDDLCEKARNAADGHVQCTAEVNGNTVSVEFVCENMRMLNIAVTIQNDATYQIDQWKMASVQQDTASAGKLWTGA